jgi:hypothetical protein
MAKMIKVLRYSTLINPIFQGLNNLNFNNPIFRLMEIHSLTPLGCYNTFKI